MNDRGTTESQDGVLRRMRAASGTITLPPDLDGATMAAAAVRNVRRRRVVSAVGGGVVGVLVLAAGAVAVTGDLRAEPWVLPGDDRPSTAPATPTSSPSSAAGSTGDPATNPLTGQSEDELTKSERVRLEKLRDHCGDDVAYPVEAGSLELPDWRGAYAHAVTRPDVPITEPPYISARSIGCSRPLSVDLPGHGPDDIQFTWELMQTVDDTGGLASYLEATWPSGPVEGHLRSLDGAEVVPFDGGVALYRPTAGLAVGVFRWVEGDVSYMLSDADADLETFKELAHSLEPISRDDPRLAPYRKK
ncbi:hypothetical protein [Myceligenerans xiligouense]|uniref:Uncharacterized protein n=1 Tax=Myceligenerans xiligouense TaxID=253184 RepID=A0A3N4YTQ4_9MICO|nr:hypothetical protein [Myceligenerans xiligouense]RPF22754.1 hypothetical protein EDD34_3426 [Myceligenerans xiligouense]